MKQTNILIIGGGPAGMVAAATARKNYPSKKITLIRKKEKAVIPCGIPYIFNRLDSVEKNLMPDESLKANNINLIIGEAKKIDPKGKKVSINDQDSISYEKLIIATGSEPIMIPIKGVEKKGVWHIEKDFEYDNRVTYSDYLFKAENKLIKVRLIAFEEMEEVDLFLPEAFSVNITNWNPQILEMDWFINSGILEFPPEEIKIQLNGKRYIKIALGDKAVYGIGYPN